MKLAAPRENLDAGLKIFYDVANILSGEDSSLKSIFVSRLLNPVGVKVTKLARGLAVGADFAGTDSLTLAKAIENRVPV